MKGLICLALLGLALVVSGRREVSPREAILLAKMETAEKAQEDFYKTRYGQTSESEEEWREDEMAALPLGPNEEEESSSSSSSSQSTSDGDSDSSSSSESESDYDSEEYEDEPLFEETSIELEDQRPCQVEGLWKNEHGSVLRLNRLSATRLSGSFQTGVELKNGSAKGRLHKVNGGVQGNLVTFSVFWDNSLTAWTGHCHRDCCDKAEERLVMTWILTEAEPQCQNHWKANRVGQNVFVRHVEGAKVQPKKA